MQNEALLNKFSEKVSEFEKYQSFIDKTKSQAAKFSAKIVEKVVNDNTEKSMNVVMELVPMTDDLESHVETLGGERSEITAANESSQFELDVLELRKVIGELSDEAFATEAGNLKDSLATVHERVAAIDEELEAFIEIKDRWIAAYEKSGLSD